MLYFGAEGAHNIEPQQRQRCTRIATYTAQAMQNISKGFEYLTEIENVKLFRKRK
jgi:hypothetical protein